MIKKEKTCQVLEILEKFKADQNMEKLPAYIIETIEGMQQEAFMEGYRYAIAILEESMLKKE